jgi:hypothetical protein
MKENYYQARFLLPSKMKFSDKQKLKLRPLFKERLLVKFIRWKESNPEKYMISKGNKK